MRTMVRYLTRHEESQLFRLLRERAGLLNTRQRTAARDLYLFKLMRHTGVRVNVVTKITCADAREALATGYLLRRKDKGGRDGFAYCNSRAKRALRGLLKVRRSFGLYEAPDDRLLANRLGAGMSVRAIQKRLAVWRQQADLPAKTSPHWFRHTLAMRVMQDSEAADPLGVVQSLLDHKNIQTTAVYTRPNREEIERVSEAVG